MKFAWQRLYDSFRSDPVDKAGRTAPSSTETLGLTSEGNSAEDYSSELPTHPEVGRNMLCRAVIRLHLAVLLITVRVREFVYKGAKVFTTRCLDNGEGADFGEDGVENILPWPLRQF